MAGRYTLHFKIFGSVAGKLEYFSGEVLQNCGHVDSGCLVWRLVDNGEEVIGKKPDSGVNGYL